MSIFQALKDLIGYSSSDYDMLFIIFSLFVCIFFVNTLFNILFALFKGGR